MPNYPLSVILSSRRLRLVAGLSLIGLLFLFPANQLERRVRSAPPEANLVAGRLAYTFSVNMIGGTFTNINTVNADGTGQARLTPGFGADGEPTWSPDGSKIVYSALSTMSDSQELYVINPNSTNRINLTNTLSVSERNPSWSVTGKIAYERSGQIWTMNPDGTNQAVFSIITQPTPTSPAWSPDGTKLAFAVGGDIWVINADGTNERRVALGGTSSNAPAWSPDGLKIAFSKRVQASFPANTFASVIYLINADGTNEVRLTQPTQGNVNDTGAAWSSDNTRIAFAKNGVGIGGIYVMNTDGANQIQIVPTGGITAAFDPAWQPFAPVPRPRHVQFDFDGDQRADLSVFRPADGVWYLLGSQSGSATVRWGRVDDKLAPADYDGDFKTDIAVWREVGADGVFYILNSSDNTFRLETFGLPGDIPMPSDWDGDGKADLAVYRNGAQSTFYYRGSMNNPNGDITFVPWGTADDRPVLGDFDGDGKTDAAVFRTSNGTWYVRASSDGQLLVTVFGSAAAASDKLVAADYDGDGKTNLALFRAGTWYIQRPTGGFQGVQFGQSGDTPAPADYEGNGLAAAAFFRDGMWQTYNPVSGTTTTTSFGASGDKPVPAAYVR